MATNKSMAWYNLSKDYLHNFIILHHFMKAKEFRSTSGYKLLGALSLELLFKACIFEIKGSLSKSDLTHQLDELAKQINSNWNCFNNNEIQYLKELKDYLSWRGKYPHPKEDPNYKGLKAVTYFDFDYGMICSIWQKLTKAYITSLPNKEVKVIVNNKVEKMKLIEYVLETYKYDSQELRNKNVVAFLEAKVNEEIKIVEESLKK